MLAIDATSFEAATFYLHYFLLFVCFLYFQTSMLSSPIFEACNTCQQRCMFSPSRSSLTALYILDPLSAPSSPPAPVCCLPPSVSSPLSSPPLCLLVHTALLGFLKYARDTNKVLQAIPPLIRSNCPASYIPLVLSAKLRLQTMEQLAPTGQLCLVFLSGICSSNSQNFGILIFNPGAYVIVQTTLQAAE